MGGFCNSWLGGENADEIHHIFSTISDSAYNAAPLTREEHARGNIMSDTMKSFLLKKTIDYLASIDYKPIKEDVIFLDKVKDYY